MIVGHSGDGHPNARMSARYSPGVFSVIFEIVGHLRRIAPQMTHDDVRECGQRA
jgi:hypothetical protein